MVEVLQKVYTVLDTIFLFFSWLYESGTMIGNYISEKLSLITALCAAIPAEWAVALSVMAAAALLYLVIGR